MYNSKPLLLKSEIVASLRCYIGDLLEKDLNSAPVQVADHCFSCTAGQGSSCSGVI
ncbi:DUF3641 domain-containing protein [Methylotuvimicrobium sp. KM1]|uniref:DUF3641 domain-containing protein n=1 Tax=Methylotuvimicrobium sp. KM1 TaxID=3377707 RepID=UPI00384C3095